MGRGSHLLAQSVGGCDSGQMFATPCRRDTHEGYFLCGLGFFVVGLCRLAGRDFCPVAFRLRPLAWFFCPRPFARPRPITPGSGDSRARVRTCSVSGRVYDQRQLSNSHSRRGLPVRRTIIRQGFTNCCPAGNGCS